MFLMDVIYQLKKQIGKTISVLLFGWCFNGYSTSIKEINRYSNGVVLFDVFNGCSISIKEINVKHLLLRKTDILKTSIFSERKFEEMH